MNLLETILVSILIILMSILIISAIVKGSHLLFTFSLLTVEVLLVTSLIKNIKKK